MQLAQVNIARMLAPIDSPIMAEFVNNLDRINAVAEQSDGFVWRLVDEDGNDATSISVYQDEYIIVNLSVWENIDSLFNFVYNSQHIEVFKRRKEWFEKMPKMHMALWYIENGKFPTAQDAKARLSHLQDHGETPYAFSFKNKFSEQDLEKYLAHKV